MYRIIGADGKEYGPVNSDQIKQWIAEGRANSQTLVLAEGATQWKPLSHFPEFFPSTPTAPAYTAQEYQMLASPAAIQEVSGPATALIVLALLHFLGVFISFVSRMAFAAMFASGEYANQPLADFFSGAQSIFSNILGILIAFVILMGGIKMKKLENFNLALAASILAILPCSCCCLIGLPIGIWSLVTLSRPEIKAAFK